MNEAITTLSGDTATAIANKLEALVWGDNVSIRSDLSVPFTRKMLKQLGYKISFVKEDPDRTIFTLDWNAMEQEMEAADRKEAKDSA